MTRPTGPGRDPITSRLMAVAGQEAERARHGYIGCEHLLLALLADKDPTARDILADQKITLAAAGPPSPTSSPQVAATGRAGTLPTCSPPSVWTCRPSSARCAPTTARMPSTSFRSPVGRRLPWGPLCGPRMAPGLKEALFTEQGCGLPQQRACAAVTDRCRQQRSRRRPGRARLQLRPTGCA